MKRLAPLLLVLLVGCQEHSSSTGEGPSQVREATEEIPTAVWEAEVLGSSEPVLVEFGASWCGPCRMMTPVLASLARDYKVWKVDVDGNRQLALRYDASSLPALLIFRDGNVVDRYTGFTEEAILRSALRGWSRNR